MSYTLQYSRCVKAIDRNHFIHHEITKKWHGSPAMRHSVVMQDNKTASKKELKINFVPTGDCWNSKADQNNLHWSLATTGQGSILHKGNLELLTLKEWNLPSKYNRPQTQPWVVSELASGRRQRCCFINSFTQQPQLDSQIRRKTFAIWSQEHSVTVYLLGSIHPACSQGILHMHTTQTAKFWHALSPRAPVTPLKAGSRWATRRTQLINQFLVPPPCIWVAKIKEKLSHFTLEEG